MEAQQQDGAHLSGGRGRGHGRLILRSRAALSPLLPGEWRGGVGGGGVGVHLQPTIRFPLHASLPR